jgi:hypothetical protein
MTALNIQALIASLPSTSGFYVFSVTRDQIIRQAMLDIGALQEAEYPTGQEISDCAFKLNMLTKQWMGYTDFAPGLKVWTRKRADLFLGNTKYFYNLGQTGDNWVDSTTGLAYPQAYGQTTLTANAASGATVLAVASNAQINIGDYVGVQSGSDIYWTTATALGINTVTIAAPGLPSTAGLANAYLWNYTTKGVRPLKMITVVLRDIYSTDIPIRIIETPETYEALPTKTAPSNISQPAAIYYEPQFKTQQPNGALYLDCGGVQDITYHLHCVYLAPTQDFVNPGDAPDYPQEWYRALVFGLARDICGMFDCAWTSDLEGNYQDALAIARQSNAEVSEKYFQVDEDYSPYGVGT